MRRLAFAAVTSALLACAPAGEAGDGGAANCPPAPPYGTAVGAVAGDLAFAGCDGAPVRLHDLCGRVALVVSYYGWCASCSYYARLGDTLARDYGARGLAALVVIVEDATHQPATAATCAEVRTALGLGVPTALDPAHGLEAYGDTDLVMVLDRGGQIVFQRQGPDPAAVTTAIEAALAE
ncbi:MAG TPA: redoxin family protein [Polyangia bacterium]|jgi:hypothetical protein